MYLVPKQGSLLMKYFPKNLTLQADAPPSSLIAEGEGEYGSLRCALVISSFAEEKIVLERLARVVRGQVKRGAKYQMFPRWTVTVQCQRVAIANALGIVQYPLYIRV